MAASDIESFAVDVDGRAVRVDIGRRWVFAGRVQDELNWAASLAEWAVLGQNDFVPVLIAEKLKLVVVVPLDKQLRVRRLFATGHRGLAVRVFPSRLPEHAACAFEPAGSSGVAPI